MTVSLTKGGNVSLTKNAPGLTAVTVGLGWDPRTTTGADFDLDASAIGADLSVRREVRYISGGQSALDKAFGWGMTWAPGRK